MAPKKKAPARKSKPTKRLPKAAAKKKAAPKKALRKAAPLRKAKAAKKAAPPSPAKPMPELAQRMAAFSEKIIQEEEAPVAVRTFNEARAGIEKSKELDVRSGAVKPVDSDESDADEMVMAEPEPRRPQMEPLTGKLAVPKTRETEEFKLAAPAKKGKKGKVPTKDDLGKIELRMQRGTTDKTVAKASPDYLQRSFKMAAQSGKTAAAPTRSGDADENKFEVAQDKRMRPLDASLTDFGDVEIAQQTRKGKRTLGTLDTENQKEGDS